MATPSKILPMSKNHLEKDTAQIIDPIVKIMLDEIMTSFRPYLSAGTIANNAAMPPIHKINYYRGNICENFFRKVMKILKKSNV